MGYEKDKRGWVTFNNGRDKKKLRKYVSDLATKINSLNKDGYNVNRKHLIHGYNDNGMKGLNKAAEILIRTATA